MRDRSFERAMLALLEGHTATLQDIAQRLGRIEGKLDQMTEDVLALKLAMHSHPESDE